MPQYKEGQTATNPSTGQKIRYEGGLWVAVQGGGAAVNNGAPGAGFFSESGAAPKLSPQEQKFRIERVDAAQKASALAQDANRFVSLNESVSTGGIDDWGPVGAVTSVFDPKKSEMRAIQSKLAPSMREAGSGAMSDKDVAMYQASTVSIDKPGKANQSLARVVDAGAKRQGDYVAFLDEWIKNKKTTIGASEAWLSYANANPLFEAGKDGTQVRQYTPWREWFGLASPVGGGQGGKGSKSDPYDLSGAGTPGSRPYQDALAKLPKGAIYRDPMGNLREYQRPTGNRVIERAAPAPKTQGNGWKFLGEVK
ncbi:MAG: hypothetical protein Q7T61_00880 [Caulobacter sp.]|nr:hypothetical protein [Caulobacter sp.]